MLTKRHPIYTIGVLSVLSMGTIAMSLIAISIYHGIRMARLEMTGLHAGGKVASLIKKSPHDYDMIIDYKTEENVHVTFIHNIGGNSATLMQAMHEGVPVLYLPENPRNDVIVDLGAKNWKDSLSDLLLGAGLLVFSLRAWSKRPKRT